MSKRKRERKARATTTTRDDADLNGDLQHSIEEEEEFDVEEILGKRTVRGRMQYYVKWRGYPMSDCSWEPRENLTCPDLIRQYEKSINPSSSSAVISEPAHTVSTRHLDTTPAPNVVSVEPLVSVGCETTAPSSRTVSTPAVTERHQRQPRYTPTALNTESEEVLVSVVHESTAPSSRTASSPAVTERRQRPPNLHDMYLDTLVAFSPASESWLQEQRPGKKKDSTEASLKIRKKFEKVGSTYIIARVCTFNMKKGLYEIRWVDTMFQNDSEFIGLEVVKRGQDTYAQLRRYQSDPHWMDLCRSDPDEQIQLEGELADLEEYESFYPEFALPTNVEEVESLTTMRFVPNGNIDPPADLFAHSDGSTTTRIRPAYRAILSHSASSSFFAYLPVSYWKQVLQETNLNARSLKIVVPFHRQELMSFLGILWYMVLVDKGEYANYWGPQVVEAIFSTSVSSLDHIMALGRFKELRKAFCFRDPASITTADKEDAAVRIRSFLNLLKLNGSKYVDVGRNLSVDEASIACRSKFVRHLIMYNPTKPSGKYHFRLYMCCCATSWIALNFRLHCTSSIERRVEGIINDAETRDLQHDLESTNKVRQHVLEVVHSFNGSGRIVNSDNYYTSVQLLDALRVKGLYGRGTVRCISKHFPRHVILEESKNRTQATAAEGGRGACRQGVSLEHRVIAASWCDGNIVTVASNADPSEMTQVTRMVGGERQQFSAPVCIREYNNHMQGVDRNDQLRGRFSITDSHSFKKWFKKLGAGVVDIARVNAYLTRQLALGANTTDRDPHRRFVVDLVTELITGRWRDAPGSDSMMVHSSGRGSLQARSPNPRARIPNLASPAPNMSSPNPSGCTALASRQVFPNSRKKRQCVVCRFENRPPTEVTAICSKLQPRRVPM